MVEKRNEKERFPFVFNFGQRFVQMGIFGALLEKALLHMFSFSMLLAFAFIYKNISWFRSFYLIPLSFPCSCLPSFLLPLLLSFFWEKNQFLLSSTFWSSCLLPHLMCAQFSLFIFFTFTCKICRICSVRTARVYTLFCAFTVVGHDSGYWWVLPK